MEIAITKMSSKGQVVIPAGLRKGLKKGEQLVIIHTEGQLIMKKANELQNIAEDLRFAKRTEAALQRINQGKGTRMDFDDFIEEMKKW